MRLFVLARLCVAASLLNAGAAHAANDGSFRIGDWSGRPYFSEQKAKKQKEKRFDRCAAQQTNADKITMIFSLDSHYMWTFDLANPSWNFPNGSNSTSRSATGRAAISAKGSPLSIHSSFACSCPTALVLLRPSDGCSNSKWSPAG